ncbi:MAG: DUF393 domain-containing protein [Chitinophagaceae bacterium]|nr:MAG: DUF393 domain-containing protein [Chitinophagaceae bacterium]
MCNYCNAMVNFVLRADRKKKLRFAALQSEAGQRLLAQHGLPPDSLDSFFFIERGQAWDRSSAVLQVLRYLPWYFQPARIGWLLPRSWRDGLYNRIARNRYRWFGRRDACMIPTPEIRARFLE